MNILTFLATLVPTTYTLSYILHELLVVPAFGSNLIIGAVSGLLAGILLTGPKRKAVKKEKEQIAVEYLDTYFDSEDEKISKYIKKVKERQALKNDFMYMD